MKYINRSFEKREELDKWVRSLDKKAMDDVYRVKIDGDDDYISFIEYPTCGRLILISPMIFSEIEEHIYNTVYPQTTPFEWTRFEVISQMTEQEALIVLTKDPLAKVYEYD